MACEPNLYLRSLQSTGIYIVCAANNLLALALPSKEMEAADSKGTTLLVIGAGAAGLAAAHHASKHGARVVVLEARQRVGGRVCTEAFEDGPFEMGAEFIHGASPGNPLCAMPGAASMVGFAWDEVRCHDTAAAGEFSPAEVATKG